ncbi:hypothetical protein Sango_1889100 [Sesamum angolense]|uniref:Retrotransposon gag domain-containing protein n=1 Tax=Sesamum angolense TaxID=2727404 RepID=A0AAE1WJA3_9LAMI|nr:hypothetical protein Sango_1889100 [Sesamum angolense]
MKNMGIIESPMMEYSFPIANGTISSIAKPTVQAKKIEIKSTIIQIIRSNVQLSGLPDKDPSKHLANFLEICVLLSLIVLVMMLLDLEFFHSHYDNVKDWLQSLPAGSIGTSVAITQKFLAKYVPPAKTAKMLNNITSFMQLDRESLYDAWERFKNMLRRFPYHELSMCDKYKPFTIVSL